MFLAKFNITTGEPFVADKNGNMPLIGTLIAGKAKGTIINGTIAEREGVKENVIYLCQNEEQEYTNPETGEVTVQQNVVILSTVTALEAVQAQKELGKPQLIRQTSEEAVEETTADNIRAGAL